jgi:hypothetical protein
MEHDFCENKVENLQMFDPFKLIVEVHAINEYGEGPSYAEITVDKDFLDRLVRLRRVCKENDLESVSVLTGPDRWEAEDYFRLRGDNLRVFGDLFWFEAHPKHADYSVETAMLSIADLCSLATLGTDGGNCFKWSNGKLFYASDSSHLQDFIEMVEDGEEDSVCSECGAKVDQIIGCPDGAEICEACFDNGGH